MTTDTLIIWLSRYVSHCIEAGERYASSAKTATATESLIAQADGAMSFINWLYNFKYILLTKDQYEIMARWEEQLNELEYQIEAFYDHHD